MNTSALLAGTGLAVLVLGAPTRRADALAGRGRLRPRPVRARRKAPAWLAPALVVTFALVVALADRWSLGIAAAVAGLAALSLVRAAGRERSERARRAALLVAVRFIVADLEAGARPDAALAAGAELSPHHAHDLRRAAAAAARGEPVSFSHADLAPLAHADAVAARTGAPLARVLARIADDLEQTEIRSQRLAALTAGPRASAAVLAILPLLAVLLGESIGAHPLDVLLHDETGGRLTCAGVLLDALGLVWVRRIVRSARQ